MGAHSADERGPVNQPANVPVNEPARDPGNSDPEALTADIGDDELAELLALLAEQDEIRDNQQQAAARRGAS